MASSIHNETMFFIIQMNLFYFICFVSYTQKLKTNGQNLFAAYVLLVGNVFRNISYNMYVLVYAIKVYRL